MTTIQTERLMALADRYAFHIPGSQQSDEAREALLAALQAGEPVVTVRMGSIAFRHKDIAGLPDGTHLYLGPQPAQPAQGETK